VSSDKKLLSLFGANVRKGRLDKGISQEELASLAGLHRTYIGMIERAEKNITLTSASKIAKALDIPLATLIQSDK
jgi:transcriptional regulator with XRE-family HTH domain